MGSLPAIMSDRMELSAASLDELLSQQAWMQRLARRLVADEAARDDLLQTAWLDLLKRAPRPGAGLRGFLATVLRRRSAKERRATSRRELRERRVAPRESSLPSPAELAIEIEAQRKVVAAVLALDEPQRDVIVLHYFHDFTARAIARERGLTIAAVESRLRRGLERLRAELTRGEGGDARRWALPLLPLAKRGIVDSAIGLGIGSGVLLMSKPIVAAGIAAALLVTAYLFVESDPGDRSRRDAIESDSPAVATSEPPEESEENGDVEVGPITVERDAVAEAASSPRSGLGPNELPPSCRLRVIDAFGTPAAHGEIVLERAGTIAPQYPGLDERGEANLPRSNETTWLWVFFDGSAPVRLPVSLAGESTIVTLPRGEVVAGRVEIDGVAARRPVRIELRAFDGFRALETAPAALYDWWSARNFSSVASLSTTTDEFGRFRFTGLDSGQRVVVSANDRFVRGRDDRPMPLLETEAPRDDLVLSFATKNFVSGRAVDANAQPSKHALVTLKVASRTDRDHGRSQLEADEDGRFAIPFPIEGDSITVEIRAHDGSCANRRVAAPFPTEIALGDLILTAPRTIRFRAVGPDGSPISGAEAFLAEDEDPARRSSTTDAHGAGAFSVPSPIEAREFYVVAKGYELGVASIPSDERVVDVTLARSTRLVVQLEPAGIDWGFGLFLTATAQLPAAPRDLPGLVRIAQSSPNHTRAYPEYRGGRLHYSAEIMPTGFFEFERLAPGVEWTIELLHLRRNRLVEQRVTLAPGEVSNLVLSPPKPRSVSGRIVDESSRPIRGAKIEIGWAGVRIGGVGTSDGEGRYFVNGIFADAATVLVRRSGFISAKRDGVSVPENGATLDLTLTAGIDPVAPTEDR